jgi:hypothetical protein
MQSRFTVWPWVVLTMAVAATAGCAGGGGATVAPAGEGGPLFGPAVTSIDITGFSSEPPCPTYGAGRMIQAAAASLRQLGWRVSAPPVGSDGKVLGGHEAGQGEHLAILGGTLRVAIRTRGTGAAGVSRSVELTLSAAVQNSSSGQTQAAFVIARSEALPAEAQSLVEPVILRLIHSAANELATRIGPPAGRVNRPR